MRKLIHILPIILLVVSCTKYIDIELNAALQRVVVEASITDQDIPPTVILSRTSDYFNPEKPEKVTGASVKLTGSNGEEEILSEISPGHYEAQTLRGKNGVEYTLSIEDNNDIYEATAYIPERVTMDSLVYEPSFFGFSEDTVTQYLLTGWFTDPGDRANYYQFKLRKKSLDTTNQQMRPPSTQAILLNDVNFNGRLSSFNLNRIGYYYIGDTVYVDFISIDSGTYKYLDQLNEITGGMLFGSSAPANPENNISNGAMGNFSALAIDKQVVVIR